MVMAASVGRAMPHRAAISPWWFAPISMTAKPVSASICIRESGTPMSLLRFPCVFTTEYRVANSPAIRSFAVVLPQEPVIASTGSEN